MRNPAAVYRVKGGCTLGRISAGIVTYNDFDEAAAAADTVLEHCPDAALFLVDNASADGTGQKIQEKLGNRARVICLAENLGFGKGHNTVIPELDSQYHFVLNPDVQIKSDVLQKMCDWMDAHPQAVMATPQLYFPDGRRQDLPRRVPSFMGLLARQLPGCKALRKFDRHYTMLDEDLSQPREIQFCTGSFFCIRTDVFKKMGGFDPGYFMYVEDADITRKAMQYGKVYLLPQFSAVHAWHRNPSRDARHFTLQLGSMLRYFRRWGFRVY